jgi:uroporphyrinogen-III decarboxylase
MNRDLYLRLAAAGLRMPIGTDLVLNEQPDPEAVMRDGRRLGEVMRTAAVRYATPIAMPLMDLRTDKADLLSHLGVGEQEADTFHFSEPPGVAAVEKVRAARHAPFSERNQAHIDSVRYVACESDLLPVGMAIGPFSLATKMMDDPISAVALAGMGVTAAEDPHVAMLEHCHAMAEATVARSLEAQIRAGARAILICEPAANNVYISPKQMEAGADSFERLVIQPALRIRRQLEQAGIDLIFHDCGELSRDMVRQFGERIEPAILSLGGSRKLWEDAGAVPGYVVLFGNLPTKSFYSDAAMSPEKVESLTLELVEKMSRTGHPFILGSECDVLHVPEASETIRRKVDIMLRCGREAA